MTWRDPWMLCLLVLAVPIWWRWWDHRRHCAVRFSSVAWLKQQSPSLRARTRCILPAIRMLAVGLLVVCLARPQWPHRETRVLSEGIAIQMLVDRSSSMQAMDFMIQGQRTDRLAAVKKVFREFVLGGKGLGGRPDDLIGMIAFAGYADSRCPLTLDHAFLVEALDQTEIVLPQERREEDGTAIGDAIALAVERLGDLDRRRQVASASKIADRIMILLTDGENTAGEVAPDKAALLAATCGIKIYTIGMGTTGVAAMPGHDSSGKMSLQPTRVTIDETTLKRIAGITGGQYWRATDTDSMREIYAEIGELEKTKIEQKRYYQFAEMAVDTVQVAGMSIPPMLPMVAALLALEVLLANTLLRRMP